MFAHSKTTIAAVTFMISMWVFFVSILWGIWSFDLTAFKMAITSGIFIFLSGTYMATIDDDMI